MPHVLTGAAKIGRRTEIRTDILGSHVDAKPEGTRAEFVKESEDFDKAIPESDLNASAAGDRTACMSFATPTFYLFGIVRRSDENNAKNSRFLDPDSEKSLQFSLPDHSTSPRSK